MQYLRCDSIGPSFDLRPRASAGLLLFGAVLLLSACTSRGGGGFTPNMPADMDSSVVDQVCGNNVMEGSETCDDGNVVDGDTCPSTCGATVCGDGTCEFARGEGCDTCISDCGSAVECNTAVCGDGVCAIQSTETCENCPADCGTLPICTVGACGDGKLAGAEECDDANFNSFDGCSALCKVESMYKCAGEPSACGRPPVLLGELLISEVMANPLAVDDTLGEWIEIYNATDDIVNLEGVSILNDSSQSVTISQVALVMPKSFIVLGVNGDTATNGGVPVDVEYAGLAIDDAGELLKIQVGSLVIDSVKLPNSSKAPPAGASSSVDPSKLTEKDNDVGASWCAGQGAFGAGGDLGTPGIANPTCPAPPPGVFLVDMAKVSIPDNLPSGVTRTLTASMPGCNVLSVDVDVEITHNYVGDIRVRLRGPNNAEVVLHNYSGGSSKNLIGNYPGTLNVAVGNSLETFNGIDANGVWTLLADDDDGGIAGTIVSWGLNIYCAP